MPLTAPNFSLATNIDPRSKIAPMAKVMTGPNIAEIRGKCGDVTYSRNRGGMYAAGYMVRVQPWSTRQTNYRTFATDTLIRWNANLTDNQRAAWNALAQSMQHRDQLRQAAALSGQNAYLKLNLERYAYTGIFQDDPPPNLQIQPVPQITITTLTHSPAHFIINTSILPNADTVILMWSSKPRNPGVSFFGHTLASFDYADSSTTWPFDIYPDYYAAFGAILAGKRIPLIWLTLNLVNGVCSQRLQTSRVST